MTLPALLTPTWMDPQAIIQGTGAAALWIVALIAFAECGLAAVSYTHLTLPTIYSV